MEYNYPPTRFIIDTVKRKKLLKAIVYDFLKKNNALKLYSDCYVIYNHLTTSDIERIEKEKGKPILNYCLNEAVDALCETGESFNDFFFSNSVSFGWGYIGEINRKKIETLDNKWLSLLSKLKDLR